MLIDLITVMKQEMVVFQAAIKVEMEKRKYILSANGHKLQSLTRKSETLMKEIGQLEAKRAETAREVIRDLPETNMHNPGITDMVALLKEADPPGWKLFAPLSEEYRRVALMLRKETEENQKLLASTSSSIRRLLGGLRTVAHSDADKTYSPEAPAKKKPGRSVIVNANA